MPSVKTIPTQATDAEKQQYLEQGVSLIDTRFVPKFGAGTVEVKVTKIDFVDQEVTDGSEVKVYHPLAIYTDYKNQQIVLSKSFFGFKYENDKSGNIVSVRQNSGNLVTKLRDAVEASAKMKDLKAALETMLPVGTKIKITTHFFPVLRTGGANGTFLATSFVYEMNV